MVPALRLRGRAAGHRDAAAGARAVRVAPDDAAGHGPPLPLRRVRSCVAPRHQQARREPRAKLSRRGLRWALEAIVCQHLTVARVAEGLGVSWNTANNAVLAEGRRVLIADPARFDGVTVIGVDEHVWRHTRRGDKYVTVIIDLTPVRDGTGPARLLDMVEGRSKQAFKTLARRPRPGLARRGRGRRDGRVHRVQDRHHRRAARRRRGHGPLPRRPAGRRRPGRVPPPGPARHSTATAAARTTRCTRSRRTLHTGADLLTDKQQPRLTSPVRRRRARRGRSDLGHLPAHDRRLPRPRPHPGPRADAS